MIDIEHSLQMARGFSGDWLSYTRIHNGVDHVADHEHGNRLGA